MNSLKEKLLKDIRAGEVSMRPRVYFTLKLAVLIATALSILAITVFIINFIFFSIRLNGHETLLGFGSQGFGAFLFFFPWPLLVLDIGLIALLQWLVRKFRFGYHIPVLYLVAAAVFGATLIGFALDRGTSFNDRVFEKRGHLPPGMRGFYDGARKPPRLGSGICRCSILSIEGNTLIVEDTRPVADGGATTTLTVVLPSDSRRATTTNLSVGDVIFIAGEEKDGVIQAFGVKKEKEGMRPPKFIK